MDKDLKPCDIDLLKQSISEQLNEGDGFWRSCSGCHELNEGYDTGRYSDIFKCALGLGCSECGGIGAVWDNTDYESMATHLMEQDNTRATDCRAVDLEVLKREVCEPITYNIIKVGAQYARHVVSDVIDYLASRNLIRGTVEPIEGLENDIEILNAFIFYAKNGSEFKVSLDMLLDIEKTILKAAEAYQAMTKVE